MAIQETIKTGRKYRKCIDNTSTNKKWERYSFWSKASDVEFNDGTTAENKLGGFKGVTTNENQSAGYAADVTLLKSIKTALNNSITSVSTSVNTSVANLNNLITSVSNRLGGMRFYEDSSGKYVVGADSVPKKLGNPFEVRKIMITDDGAGWWNGDTTGYEVIAKPGSTTNNHNIYIGIYSEVYVQVNGASKNIYIGAGENGMWRDDLASAYYDKSDGHIKVRYGAKLYAGGGNMCKMTILYRL
ncbi:hypothetical protein [Kineothrix sp. MB12-C1]|uniref:hypothetical protein n=1 Tax=Kineothrix sp. MB12-C1 TaxID=3070215 RepID=UPI0027D1F3B5|nr:hypothetical protein [Kineothrix sp. MB12-C1]WMC93165.1 hypothetical protein RBB56_02430 [Kineothrix sp. MB12-C1]